MGPFGTAADSDETSQSTRDGAQELPATCPVCGAMRWLCECTGFEEPDMENILIRGRVSCVTCGRNTTEQPCVDHQPRAWAAYLAENHPGAG